MIILGPSLLHIIDVESQKRGLNRDDMMKCIKTALEVNFRKRGRLVTVYIDDTEGLAQVSVQEMILTGGGRAMYREVKFIPALDPKILEECVDEFIARSQASHQWTLALAKIVAVNDDHYLAEIQDTPALTVTQSEMAVLPYSNVAKGDRKLPKSTTLWVVIKKFVHTKVEGGHNHPWEDSTAKYVASRNEGEFLALIVYQFLSLRCDCVVHTSKGLLIFPHGTEISPLLANKGQVQKQIAQLAGLERLAIVRRSDATEPDKRLIHAIKNVTQLKYGVDFKIGAANPEFLPRVYIRNQVAPKFIGAGGSSLYFIKTVANLEFDYKVKFMIGATAAKPMIVPRNDS